MRLWEAIGDRRRSKENAQAQSTRRSLCDRWSLRAPGPPGRSATEPCRRRRSSKGPPSPSQQPNNTDTDLPLNEEALPRPLCMHVCAHDASVSCVCACMHACMYARVLHVCMRAYVCMRVCMHVCVCVYACMRVCLCMCGSVYVCPCACMYVCLCLCMHACVCLCMHACVSMYECMCAWVGHGCLCMCACMYVCVHLCVFCLGFLSYVYLNFNI
jgi:hypothetical protein